MMRLLIAGLVSMAAGCAQLPDGPPASHVCVETPNGLAECSEVSDSARAGNGRA